MCSRHAGEVSLDTELLSVDPRVTLRAVEGKHDFLDATRVMLTGIGSAWRPLAAGSLVFSRSSGGLDDSQCHLYQG